MNYGQFFKRWEYQTTLPASWEICVQVKKKQLELDRKQQTGSKLGKEYVKAVYCHLAYLTYMQSTSWEMPGWMKHKLESKIAGRNINNLRHADDTTLMAESEEQLKRLLMKVKEESEKAGLKLNIQKMKIMASGPITSWQLDGETMQTVTNFIFLGSKITADGYYSPEIKHLLLGRKVMTNIDSILKSRNITLPTKVSLVRVMVFPVVMYGCESWTIKESRVLKNWYFWTVVLEKTLKSPLDCKEIKPVNPKGNQSWMFIGRTDAEAETPILWSPDEKSWLIGKDPDAGKYCRQKAKGMTEDETAGWHHRLEMDMSLSKLQELVMDRKAWCCSPWGHKERDMTEQLNWTELIVWRWLCSNFHFSKTQCSISLSVMSDSLQPHGL